MFSSILFQTPQQKTSSGNSMPDEPLHDLHLDCIFDQLPEYPGQKNLQSYFRSPLKDISLIKFRQAVMADLDKEQCQKPVETFTKVILDLETKWSLLKETGHIPDDLMDCSQYLLLADTYLSAVTAFAKADRSAFSSEGLIRFFQALDQYVQGPVFSSLAETIHEVYSRLEKIHFCMLIKDGRIKIRPYEDQRRLDNDVKELFSKFSQQDISTTKAEVPKLQNLHHIDTAVLDLLARWYKEDFRELRKAASKDSVFPDPLILQFAEESCFYLSWQKLLRPLKNYGLPFCFAGFSDPGSRLFCNDGFDLALALNLIKDETKVVTNSFYLENGEHSLVVTGPNQGGKTTFARFFGQAFYLASLGLSIPGTAASLKTSDHIWTHFNQKEDLDNLSGKLQDDIVRLKKILDHTTDQSILIINEIYASTTLQDALTLGRKMMGSIAAKGCTAVCVTFLDELASYDDSTVSMMSTVDESEPGKRNYKIIRKPADGLAHAMQLAQKYGLSFDSLSRRLKK